MTYKGSVGSTPTISLVTVAQQAEQRIVVPPVVDSSSIGQLQPIWLYFAEIKRNWYRRGLLILSSFQSGVQVRVLFLALAPMSESFISIVRTGHLFEVSGPKEKTFRQESFFGRTNDGSYIINAGLAPIGRATAL